MPVINCEIDGWTRANCSRVLADTLSALVKVGCPYQPAYSTTRITIRASAKVRELGFCTAWDRDGGESFVFLNPRLLDSEFRYRDLVLEFVLAHEFAHAMRPVTNADYGRKMARETSPGLAGTVYRSNKVEKWANRIAEEATGISTEQYRMLAEHIA